MNIKSAFLVSMSVLTMVIPVQGVFASGIAVLQGENTQDSNMKIEYLDRSTVRMNVSDKRGSDSYMLVRDGRAYMVSNSRGETIVMDMAQLGSMAKGMGMNMGAGDSFKQELLKYNRTGRSETVAGYRGDVYSLTWRDSRGTHTDEAVLSSHQNVREFSDAWMYLAKTMANSMNQQIISDDSIWNFLEGEGKGVLRLGDDFRVVSIESKNINANRFVLPAAPMQMPGMGGMGSYPFQAPVSSDKAIGGVLKGIFGR